MDDSWTCSFVNDIPQVDGAGDQKPAEPVNLDEVELTGSRDHLQESNSSTDTLLNYSEETSEPAKEKVGKEAENDLEESRFSSFSSPSFGFFGLGSGSIFSRSSFTSSSAFSNDDGIDETWYSTSKNVKKTYSCSSSPFKFDKSISSDSKEEDSDELWPSPSKSTKTYSRRTSLFKVDESPAKLLKSSTRMRKRSSSRTPTKSKQVVPGMNSSGISEEENFALHLSVSSDEGESLDCSSRMKTSRTRQSTRRTPRNSKPAVISPSEISKDENLKGSKEESFALHLSISSDKGERYLDSSGKEKFSNRNRRKTVASNEPDTSQYNQLKRKRNEPKFTSIVSKDAIQTSKRQRRSFSQVEEKNQGAENTSDSKTSMKVALADARYSEKLKSTFTAAVSRIKKSSRVSRSRDRDDKTEKMSVLLKEIPTKTTRRSYLHKEVQSEVDEGTSKTNNISLSERTTLKKISLPRKGVRRREAANSVYHSGTSTEEKELVVKRDFSENDASTSVVTHTGPSSSKAESLKDLTTPNKANKGKKSAKSSTTRTASSAERKLGTNVQERESAKERGSNPILNLTNSLPEKKIILKRTIPKERFSPAEKASATKNAPEKISSRRITSPKESVSPRRGSRIRRQLKRYGFTPLHFEESPSKSYSQKAIFEATEETDYGNTSKELVSSDQSRNSISVSKSKVVNSEPVLSNQTRVSVTSTTLGVKTRKRKVTMDVESGGDVVSPERTKKKRLSLQLRSSARKYSVDVKKQTKTRESEVETSAGARQKHTAADKQRVRTSVLQKLSSARRSAEMQMDKANQTTNTSSPKSEDNLKISEKLENLTASGSLKESAAVSANLKTVPSEIASTKKPERLQLDFNEDTKLRNVFEKDNFLSPCTAQDTVAISVESHKGNLDVTEPNLSPTDISKELSSILDEIVESEIDTESGESDRRSAVHYQGLQPSLEIALSRELRTNRVSVSSEDISQEITSILPTSEVENKCSPPPDNRCDELSSILEDFIESEITNKDNKLLSRFFGSGTALHQENIQKAENILRDANLVSAKSCEDLSPNASSVNLQTTGNIKHRLCSDNLVRETEERHMPLSEACQNFAPISELVSQTADVFLKKATSFTGVEHPETASQKSLVISKSSFEEDIGYTDSWDQETTVETDHVQSDILEEKDNDDSAVNRIGHATDTNAEQQDTNNVVTLTSRETIGSKPTDVVLEEGNDICVDHTEVGDIYSEMEDVRTYTQNVRPLITTTVVSTSSSATSSSVTSSLARATPSGKFSNAAVDVGEATFIREATCSMDRLDNEITTIPDSPVEGVSDTSTEPEGVVDSSQLRDSSVNRSARTTVTGSRFTPSRSSDLMSVEEAYRSSSSNSTEYDSVLLKSKNVYPLEEAKSESDVAFPEEKVTDLQANALFNMSFLSPASVEESPESPPNPSSPQATHESQVTHDSQVTHGSQVTHESQVTPESQVTHESQITHESQVTHESHVTHGSLVTHGSRDVAKPTAEAENPKSRPPVETVDIASFDVDGNNLASTSKENKSFDLSLSLTSGSIVSVSQNESGNSTTGGHCLEISTNEEAEDKANLASVNTSKNSDTIKQEVHSEKASERELIATEEKNHEYFEKKEGCKIEDTQTELARKSLGDFDGDKQREMDTNVTASSGNENVKFETDSPSTHFSRESSNNESVERGRLLICEEELAMSSAQTSGANASGVSMSLTCYSHQKRSREAIEQMEQIDDSEEENNTSSEKSPGEVIPSGNQIVCSDNTTLPEDNVVSSVVDESFDNSNSLRDVDHVSSQDVQSVKSQSPLGSFQLVMSQLSDDKDDPPVLSQLSVSGHKSERDEGNTIAITPLKPPPSNSEIRNSLAYYGLPQQRHQDPFCSNPDDIPEIIR